MVQEEVFGRNDLWKNKISTRLALFRSIKQVSDLRRAKSDLKSVRSDELTLEHIRKTKGDIVEYLRKHKDAIKHGEAMVEELEEDINFDIADLQTLKHVLREMYKGDEKLMKAGIPPRIGHDLETGDKHTEQKVNEMLRRTSNMLGGLTGVDNF